MSELFSVQKWYRWICKDMQNIQKLVQNINGIIWKISNSVKPIGIKIDVDEGTKNGINKVTYTGLGRICKFWETADNIGIFNWRKMYWQIAIIMQCAGIKRAMVYFEWKWMTGRRKKGENGINIFYIFTASIYWTLLCAKIVIDALNALSYLHT